MEPTYTKVDDTTLQVTKEETTQESTDFKLDFLRDQEISILKQKNDFCEARDKELKEVRALLLKAEELGIKSEKEVALAEEEAREENLE
jgi:hypothetical protein